MVSLAACPAAALLLPVEALPPFRGASTLDVSDHAAAQWGRRVRSDVRLLLWCPRSPLPTIRPEGLTADVKEAIAEARADLVRAAQLGRFERRPPDWVGSETNHPGLTAWLAIGTDHVLVLRWCRDRWRVVTTLVKHGLESPYSWQLRHDRLQRRWQRRPGKILRGPEAYRRARAGHRGGRDGADQDWSAA